MQTFISRQAARLGRAAAPILTPALVARPLKERLRSHAIVKAVRPSRSEAEAMARLANVETSIHIDRDRGMGKISLDPEMVAACVADTKRRFELMKAGQSGQRNTKQYLQSLTALEDYDDDSAPFKMATSPGLAKAIADYLGAAPVLWTISAMYSPPTFGEVTQWRGSQYWHRDSEDIASIKVWILCSDVGEENGPTNILPRKLSDEIAVKVGYRQGEKILDDKVIEPYASDVEKITGTTGDAFVTDTCRCLHMGSRTGNTSDRLALVFNFLTRHSIYSWPAFRSQNSRKVHPGLTNLSDIQKDLLFPF